MDLCTGRCDKWIVRELQRLGDEEERAGAGLHVQPHQHRLHSAALRLHLRGDHQVRKVQLTIFFCIIYKDENSLISCKKCVVSI